MKRFEKLFSKLNENGKNKAFIPFVTLGDPDFETSKLILDCLMENGADALELGMPFSDPLLDGEVIQQANNRAIASGNSTKEAFQLIEYVRTKNKDIPISILCAANLIYAQGIDNFYQQARQVGIDAVLVADIPVYHAHEFIPHAKKHAIQPVFICPPNADQNTVKEIAKLSEGYVYLVSRAGVTSAENNKMDSSLSSLVDQLKSFNSAPVIQGFGISSPQAVKEALKFGVDGVFIGSAIVKIIQENIANNELLEYKLSSFCREIKNSCVKT